VFRVRSSNEHRSITADAAVSDYIEPGYSLQSFADIGDMTGGKLGALDDTEGTSHFLNRSLDPVRSDYDFSSGSHYRKGIGDGNGRDGKCDSKQW
jgi:hypothetical protein